MNEVCINPCGDGMLESNEICDDSNNIDNDGCSSTCNIETGWMCAIFFPSVCMPICGDGFIVGSE